MTSGVERQRDEIDEIKRKITEHLATGIGRTFYGACQVAGVGVSEAYRWQNEDADFKTAVEQARYIGGENAIDLAEKGAMALLQKEDPKTVRWFLETKGKNRGYTKRSEVTGKDGAPLNPLTAPNERATEEEGLQAITEMVRRPG